MMRGCRFNKQTAYAVRGRAFSSKEEVTGDNEVLVKVDSHNDVVLSSS
jgi:hypothetical protein